LENGKTITIQAPNNSAENRYVNSISVNGKPYSKNWFSHKAITQGATINFGMSKSANKQRGITEDAFPYSYSTPSK
jgi:putative alpha-1,2-mannosidase